MGPLPVVVGRVLVQDCPQMRLAEELPGSSAGTFSAA
jgi:hypothetical protein